ncbi:MAG: RNA polymerase sigma factor RpoE [Gammaproteobacteria bacterium SHHR-1]|uniref:RNA polymerase sigma factor RpoE n=1 Tax=Magnetovirga frankeli TaxID=947516 RepID=UPI001293BBDA|nr:RNA polymerase sigma factor RpoE [gamma proteobacterium SS-5]
MTEQQPLDTELVARAQQGDKRAFDLLVIRYQQRVVSLIMRYVKDPDEALDVAQEAFVKAYRALPRFRGDSAFFTWLFRIAVNAAKNYLSSAAGRRNNAPDIDRELAERVDDSGRLRELSTPEDYLCEEELVQVLHKAIQDLPEDLRSALTLREMEGLSYEEIAQVMDCPIGTVRSRIFRAREAVDARIKPLLGH